MITQKILIVDDEPGLRDILANRFADDAWEVVTAGDGEEALVKVRAERFDLVLLDLLMPKMNGLEFLARVREDAALAGLLVIVLTVSASGDDIKQALALGAKDYFVKSYDSIDKILEWAKIYTNQPAK